MGPVEKALWFIESHSRESITLEDISQACGVTRFHLSRAFSAITGWPIMRYLRNRRLSLAARRLAEGAPDILCVALDAGYNSHEAFTRAFRDHFGPTPEQVRALGTTAGIRLTDAMRMPTRRSSTPLVPLFASNDGLRLAGICERYSMPLPGEIPDQWQRFLQHIEGVRDRTGDDTYGVSFDFDEEGSYSYLCGVPVSEDAEVSSDLSVVDVPARHYAVFRHPGHIAGIAATYLAIWDEWLPESDSLVADAPAFERYASSFDSETGLGGVEIWVPLDQRGTT